MVPRLNLASYLGVIRTFQVDGVLNHIQVPVVEHPNVVPSRFKLCSCLIKILKDTIFNTFVRRLIL